MIYSRYLYEEVKEYFHSPESVILTGMRRTGKTTLLNLIYGNVETENKILLDFENPLNRKYFEEENYEKIRASFEFLGINFAQRPYIFLDEIQFLKNIPSVVKYFIDHYKVKFFLTGSASYYLKNLFTESLAGRKTIFEVFPLSFSEFLIFKNAGFNVPEKKSDVTRSVYETIAPLYDEYMLYGGFPEVVLKGSLKEKQKALEDIFTSFFQLEVVQLGNFRRNEIIRDLMLLLLQSTGSGLDIQRISRDLKVARPTLYDYLAFLEGTYFIKTIRPFSKGKSTELRKIPKVYACDTGIANHFARLDTGHLFENSVFQNLRIKGKINYYQRKSGGEIDFILNKEDAFEVKLNPDESDLRKLKTLAADLSLNEYKIISKNYSEMENVIYGFMLH